MKAFKYRTISITMGTKNGDDNETLIIVINK